MGLINEIREIGDKKYEVVKTPCDCICHKQSGVMHIMACCNDGFSEHLVEIKTTKMETKILTVNDVKKELYRTKMMAKFSHYISGNLYYTVELSDGTYQFPISTTEKVQMGVLDDKEGFSSYESNMLKLSSDLGTTAFSAEMKASELNRWVAKAMEKNDFIKIS
jgi:hypothetical protein